MNHYINFFRFSSVTSLFILETNTLKQIILCLNSEQWVLMEVNFSTRSDYIGAAFESLNISAILRLHTVWVRLLCHKV